MALNTLKSYSDTLLSLKNSEEGLFKLNHIFEPEYHQDKYVNACIKTSEIPGAFQLGEISILVKTLNRGIQPLYADKDDDPETLNWEGMIQQDGVQLNSEDGNENVCALKSNCIRTGYVDTSLARSVSRSFYEKIKNKAGVIKNDILINSTGDGTIGRVAVFMHDFPAMVDGHVTIVRLYDADLAWYVAAFLLTENGQNQIYRYINGSSGQVEIYPQDLERIWIKPASPDKVKEIAESFRNTCLHHYEFYKDLKATLHQI